MSRCPHGYELEDLRTGASVCEKCSETHRTEDQRGWPDSVWLWHDGTTLVVALEKPTLPDGQRARAVQYGRFLDRATLEKLASAEDGIDVGRYVNNLLRIVHNQQREIARLHERIGKLHELVHT